MGFRVMTRIGPQIEEEENVHVKHQEGRAVDQNRQEKVVRRVGSRMSMNEIGEEKNDLQMVKGKGEPKETKEVPEEKEVLQVEEEVLEENRKAR